MQKIKLPLIISLVVAMLRLLPHPIGCSPLIALAVLSMQLPSLRKYALLFASLTFVLSSITTMHIWYGWWIQPVSLLLVMLISKLLKCNSFSSSVTLGVTSSVVYFLITNALAWVLQALPYPITIAGLLQSYYQGLPFFYPQLFWDVSFVVLIRTFYYYLSPKLEFQPL